VNIASRFQPFYGETPELPRGPSIKRISSPIQGESSNFTFDPSIPLGYGPGQKWTGDRHDFAMVRPPYEPVQGPGDWVPPPDTNLEDYPNPFKDGFPSPGDILGPGSGITTPDTTVVEEDTEDLGTPWYLQVLESGAPTMPWNVYGDGFTGATTLAPTSNKFNPKTGDFYTYTGPASSSAESAKEVYYEPFYHTPEVRNDPRFFGDRWSIPESLKTAKASLASLYGEDSNTGTGWVRPDDGPSTDFDWPGMESWLASSGIPEEDWNSSLYQAWRYNSAAPINWRIPDPMTVSYPFAYDYKTSFGGWS